MKVSGTSDGDRSASGHGVADWTLPSMNFNIALVHALVERDMLIKWSFLSKKHNE